MKKLIVLILLATTIAHARVGSEGIGGGDEQGIEVQMAVYTGLKRLELMDEESFRKMSAAGLSQVLSKIKYIVIDEPLHVHGAKALQNPVAVNDIQNTTIYIQRSRWQSLKNVRIREGVIIHEIASLLGLESTGVYTISAKYLAESGVSSFDLQQAEITDISLPKDATPSKSPFTEDKTHKRQDHGYLRFSCSVVKFFFYPKTGEVDLYAVNDPELKEFYSYFQINQVQQFKSGNLKIEASVSDGPYYAYHGTRTELDLFYISQLKQPSNKANDSFVYQMTIRVILDDDYEHVQYEKKFECQVDRYHTAE